MLTFAPSTNGRPLRLLALAAHCDDVEIGSGATVLRLLREHHGSALRILIAAADAERSAEARASARHLASLAPGATIDVHVASFEENVLPANAVGVREFVLEHGRPFGADIVFCPHLADRHQDHRVVAETAHQLFRDHPIFEYEIAKFDGDLLTPNVYVAVTSELAAEKVELLDECFVTQRSRTWFDREAFYGLMRLRGIECNARYAEGFHVRKLVL